MEAQILKHTSTFHCQHLKPLIRGAEFHSMQVKLSYTTINQFHITFASLLVKDFFFLIYYVCLNVCSFVSCHLTHFLQIKRVCLDEFYWNSTDHLKTPVRWTNSKAFPTPITSKKKLNFYTAHNLSV